MATVQEPTGGKTRLTFADVQENAPTARAGKLAGNPYLPQLATVIDIVPETPNIKSFRVRFDDDEVMSNFSFDPGQVGQLGILGVGESTFAINSSNSEKAYVQFSVMKTGEVTTRTAFAAQLAHGFDDREDAVHAGVRVRQAAAVGVHREVAARRGALAGRRRGRPRRGLQKPSASSARIGTMVKAS